jgi:hypothetical protein
MLSAEQIATGGAGVRLVLVVGVGAELDTIELEGAHLESLVRTAAHVAVRDGLLGIPETAFASIRPGTIKTWHGAVACLDSLAIELRDERGCEVSRLTFPRQVLGPFVTARAVHHVVASQVEGRVAFASSLHAIDADEPPWPVHIPPFPAWSLHDLAAQAVAEGSPAEAWIATFVTAEVLDGLAALERTSRACGVEAAGRIHARVGFDRRTHTFIRILERLVVTRDAVATGSTVVSSAASWGEFLAARPSDGPSAACLAHTHLHLADGGESRDDAEVGLDRHAKPMISIADRVTHLTTFTDPLSAGLIVSLYPDRRVVTLYGYRPDGTFDAEPGYWVLPRQHERSTPT